MAALAVDQGYNYPLGLGGCNRWYEIAVPGNEHRLANVALGGKLHHIDSKQKEIDWRAVELILKNALQVSTIYKYRNATCQIAPATQVGRLRKAALLRT